MPSVWLSCRLCSGSAHRENKKRRRPMTTTSPEHFPRFFFRTTFFFFLSFFSLLLSRFIWPFLFNSCIHPVSCLFFPFVSAGSRPRPFATTHRPTRVAKGEKKETDKKEKRREKKETWGTDKSIVVVLVVEVERGGEVRPNIFPSRQLSRRWQLQPTTRFISDRYIQTTTIYYYLHLPSFTRVSVPPCVCVCVSVPSLLSFYWNKKKNEISIYFFPIQVNWQGEESFECVGLFASWHQFLLFVFRRGEPAKGRRRSSFSTWIGFGLTSETGT